MISPPPKRGGYQSEMELYNEVQCLEQFLSVDDSLHQSLRERRNGNIYKWVGSNNGRGLKLCFT